MGQDMNYIEVILKWSPLLLQGFLVDILVSMAAMLIGTMLGIIVGIGQLSRTRLMRVLARWTTQFFRNAPWLVLLFFCILLLPYQVQIWDYSLPIPAWAKGIIGLALPVMGNVSEVVRGGIQSIPSAQWEAAEGLALTRRQTLRIIIFPQAIKRMLPPWMNTYAVLMMATPLISIVGVNDIVLVARAVLDAERDPGLLLPIYGLLLLLFFLYCAPIARLTRKLETRFAVR